MSELLDLLRKNIRAACENEVAGMVGAPASYDDLAEAREALIEAISVALTASERESLLSIKAAKPRWELMDLPGIVNVAGNPVAAGQHRKDELGQNAAPRTSDCSGSWTSDKWGPERIRLAGVRSCSRGELAELSLSITCCGEPSFAAPGFLAAVSRVKGRRP